MKVIVRNLAKEGKELDTVKIVSLSDIHLGSKSLDKKELDKTLKYIEEHDDVYCILNGDLIDCTLKNSVGSVYENVMTPMMQVLELVKILTPIKDKILVISLGNHEARSIKETSIDVLLLVARELGIEDRYAPGFWYLYLYFGKKTSGARVPMVYTITGYHGSGGGRGIGGKMNRLVDMSNIAVADLYIMGHTHTPMSTKKCIYIPDYNNKSLSLREMHYMMSNSFLKYSDSYGEVNGYHPTSNTTCEAILNGKKREIRIVT